MNTTLFEDLYKKDLLSEVELQAVKDAELKPVLSVHWELKTLLYLGVILLTGGLGIIVYKNIDTIGHQAVIAAIGIACLSCFFYCKKKAIGYANNKIESPNIWYDYILLLGCLLLITFLAYLQYAYNVFGTRLGMATFIPMVILFCTAYYFDHLGVLSLAVTNLATWVGITITPMQLLKENDFESARLIYTGIALGLVLIGLAFISTQKNIKAHFAFTYKNFGTHLLFVALLAGMFQYSASHFIWFVIIAGVCWYYFYMALKEKSFYFLVITALYGYIALSYVVIRLLTLGKDFDVIYLGIFYFIGSSIGLIVGLIRYNKILKK